MNKNKLIIQICAIKIDVPGCQFMAKYELQVAVDLTLVS